MSLVDAKLILDAPELRRERDKVVRQFAAVGRPALTDTAREGEQELEALTRQAAGGKLWRAWKSIYFVPTARFPDEAASIFLNGTDRTVGAISYLTENGRVAKRGGGSTWIPLPAAGGRTIRRGRAHIMMTPDEWMKKTGLKLKFVPRRGRRAAMLVLEQGRLAGKRGIARAGSARAERGATIPIFVLFAERAFSAKFSTSRVTGRLPGVLAAKVAARLAAIPDA